MAEALNIREINLAFGTAFRPGDLDAFYDDYEDVFVAELIAAAHEINKPRKK